MQQRNPFAGGPDSVQPHLGRVGCPAGEQQPDLTRVAELHQPGDESPGVGADATERGAGLQRTSVEQEHQRDAATSSEARRSITASQR